MFAVACSGRPRSWITIRTGWPGVCAPGVPTPSALVLPDIENPFFTSLVKGAERAAGLRGWNLILCNSDEDVIREEALVRTLVGREDRRAAPVPGGRPARLSVPVRWATPHRRGEPGAGRCVGSLGDGGQPGRRLPGRPSLAGQGAPPPGAAARDAAPQHDGGAPGRLPPCGGRVWRAAGGVVAQGRLRPNGPGVQGRCRMPGGDAAAAGHLRVQ